MGFMYVNPNIVLDNGLQNAMWSYNNKSLQAGNKTGGPAGINKIQSTDGADLKLERIINKFKSGKKLSSKEMVYLSEKAPELYQKVLRITQEREQLEREMQAAESKEEVAKIVSQKMGSIEKMSGGDEFEETSRANQYSDAYSAYIATDEYKAKVNSEIDTVRNTFKNGDKESEKEEVEKLLKKNKRRRSQINQSSSLLPYTLSSVPAEISQPVWYAEAESDIGTAKGEIKKTDGQPRTKKTYLRTGKGVEGKENNSGATIDVAF